MSLRLALMVFTVTILATGMQSAQADFTTVLLSPDDLGSSESTNFDLSPSDAPELFGFSGPGIRIVDFDTAPDGSPIAEGTRITDQYASLGVLVSTSVPQELRAGPGVFEGPSSAPNATFLFDGSIIFNFTVPVDAVGVVNTSPDGDFYEFFSGQDGTGDLLGSFQDIEFSAIDQFAAGFADSNVRIGSFVVTNSSDGGSLELDDLVFRVVPEPTSIALSLTGLVGLAAFARRSWKTRA